MKDDDEESVTRVVFEATMNLKRVLLWRGKSDRFVLIDAERVVFEARRLGRMMLPEQ